MRVLISGLVLMSLVGVAAAELGVAAKKELKASMNNTKVCKRMIIEQAPSKSIQDKTIDKIDKLCGNGALWFKGCKVLSQGKDTCAFIQVDEDTRLDEGKKLYFPKDFR